MEEKGIMGRLADMIVESIKAAPGQIKEMAIHKWDQGRDELGKALMHGQDGFMPWPDKSLQQGTIQPEIEAVAGKMEGVREEVASVRESMDAISAEMREDYQLRAQINAMQVESPEPERGLSR